MPSIRIPYPADLEHRKRAFRRLASFIARFGTVEGTHESGTVRGSTPIGGFAGTYSCPDGSDELIVHITKKPILIGMSRIESELRKFLSADTSSVG